MKVDSLESTVTERNFLYSVLLFLIGFTSLFSQNKEFNQVYNKAATDYIFSDPDRAFFIADSLFKISGNETEKIRSLMLKAGVYLSKSDLKNSRDVARQADLLAKDSKNYQWQFRAKGFLANIYQKIQFVDEGMKVLNEMDKIIAKEKDPVQQANMLLLNIQSKANLLKNQIEADSLLYYLNQGQEYYKTVEELSEGNYMIAYNEHLRGLAYYEKEDYKNSAISFQKTLELLEQYQNPNYHIYGFVYMSLGGIAYKLDQDTAEANKYFTKTLDLMSKNAALRENIFLLTELRDYYQYIGNFDQRKRYEALLDAAIKNLEKDRNDLAKDFYDEIQQDSENAKMKLKVFYFLAVGLGVMLIIIVFRLIKLKNKEKHIVASLVNDRDSEKQPQPENPQVLLISADTEKKIAERLDSFEKENLFLQPEMNMDFLASYCDSNTRYVSQTIKKYKEKDFHQYINTLRIDYIVKKLEDEIKFRKYKISVLAEKCGFSSHSKFSSTFKEIKGVTPSAFIRNFK